MWDISWEWGSSPLTLAPGRRKFSCFSLRKKWIPRSTPDWCSNPFFKSRAITTNEIQIYFSNNKPHKNEIQIRFSKWCENEKRNPYPFFKVMRKRKTKNEVQMRFSKLGENEKQKAKFRSVFQCHAKRKNGIWIPFSRAIEKRLALRYTHCDRLI